MKEKILFLTAYVPNKAAAGEKNTMIMLNDLASCYDVDLIYFKYERIRCHPSLYVHTFHGASSLDLIISLIISSEWNFRKRLIQTSKI